MRAGRLFSDVHRIARAYHWGEAGILRLTLKRRTAYLELIERESDTALVRNLVGDSDLG
jgi:hypothetical protein